MIGHNAESETNYKPVSRILQELSRKASFLHIIEMEKKVRDDLVWPLWVRILDYETKRLWLHKELKPSSNSASGFIDFCFLTNFGCLILFSFVFILLFLRCRHEILARDVELLWLFRH
jgi:hypothetical protein